MLTIVPILRFLHIIAGIIWAGGAILMNLFIVPTIAATGDAGKQFVGHLIGKTAFTKLMTVAGFLTVLAGIMLYGINSSWFHSGWMMTGQGIGFGVGAMAGIAAFVFGIMIGNVNMGLAKLGSQIQGKPTDAQMTEMQALRKRQAFVVPGNTICMVIAIVFMASARFFG